MEFSQYVKDAVASVDYVKRDRDFNAISLIRGAAEKATTDLDTHILDVIAGSMTMAYKKKEQVFAPLFVEYGGGRSFGPEDLSEEDIEILRTFARMTASSVLQAKFSHIVWTLTKECIFAQLAVTGYLNAFEQTFDPVHWVSCFDKIQAAYCIASAMGKKGAIFKQTHATILRKLEELNGTDPLFLSIRLLKLVHKDIGKEELEKFATIAEIIFNKNTDSGNDNTHLTDESIAVLEPIYKRMGRDTDIKTAKAQYAGYYEIQARKRAEKLDYLRAVHLMKNACLHYVGVDRDKLLSLRLEMEVWQKRMLKELKPLRTKIDIKDYVRTIDLMFEGLTVEEAIIQFGRISRVYKVEEVKQQLLAEQDEQFCSAMFGSVLLNDQGHSVQQLQPIGDTGEDSNAFFNHMVRYVAERRKFHAILVDIAFQRLQQYGNISEADLDILVQNNPMIPANRVEIIREGLYLALNGKLYSAMHILQPQTENIFRRLVRMCGDTVTFLKEDGTEEFKPLSALFKSDKLTECYDEDLIFTFRSIMDEPAGENLRNLNGHGLLEPAEGNGSGALYFVSLLIKLLSYYGKQARDVHIKLARKT